MECDTKKFTLLTKYQGDDVKKDDMAGACSTRGGRKGILKFL